MTSTVSADLSSIADDLVPEDDELRLIMALATTRGAVGFTTREATAVVTWARRARMDAALVDLVIKGGIRVNVGDDGQILVGGKAP